MKTNAISITIPQPCSQNWDTMEQQEGKRFCTSCQNSVIDFSTFNNVEIIALLGSSNKPICGRITNRQLTQLNYHLIVAPAQRNWMKYIGVLAIGASIFLQGCDNSKKDIPMVNSIKKIPLENDEKVSVIYGYVVADNEQPIRGVRVIMEHTKLVAITDSAGRYEFDKNFIMKNNLLRVSSSSFEGFVVADFTKSAQNKLKVEYIEPIDEQGYATMGMISLEPPKVKQNK